MIGQMRVVGLSIAIAWVVVSALHAAPAKVTINQDRVTEIDGKKVFPITFTVPPPPDAKAHNGKGALEEFRDAGAIFIRTGPMLGPSAEPAGGWDEQWLTREQQYMDAAAKAGMYCAPWLKELSAIEDPKNAEAEKLRMVIRKFRDHPGLGVWKGEDEPQWGKKKVGPLVNAYKIIHEEDPNHPVWIVQAPRGSVVELQAYNPSYDVGGVDIYPLAYPPGGHVPQDANKEISMVGDYTRKMIKVVDDKKPIWLTLQIAWSGVAKPGKTLRFPTFFEQRFMTYQAIINGARGIVYFGGALPMTLNERDKPLGWNWTYWQRTLRPVIEEIGDKSPLAEALVAPESKMKLKMKGEGIEWCVREVGSTVYLLACSRESKKTQEVEFSGLGAASGEAAVLYESPRKVALKDGKLMDWFAPFDVHVYRIGN